MKNSIPRITAAGLAGGLTMTLAILLTFRLIGFGWAAGTVFIDTSAKGQQKIAEWITIEPIPLLTVNPKPFIIGLLLFSMIHAWVYAWLSPSWPQE
jgi:hypothetical protein